MLTENGVDVRPLALINASAVRKMALDISRSTRCGKFTRVSEQFLLDANATVAAFVRQRVHSAPSVGKTL